MKTFKHFILFFCVLALFMAGCEQTDLQEMQSDMAPSRIQNSFEPENPYIPIPEYTDDDTIVLGAQRQNPYEIDNMLMAYDYLQTHYNTNNFIYGNEEPYINTIYYRVLPHDTIELASLSADTSVIYFDYPLDYDIERWGSYYHDPTVDDQRFTWLYAVVPLGHPLPDLPLVEVLAKCYIPDEPTEDYDYDNTPDWQNGFAMLEYVAYSLSGNRDMFDEESIDMFETILSYRGNIPTADNDSSASETNNERSGFWDFITGVYPTGRYTVENPHTETKEGIKNAKVFIHNIVKCYCGPLNTNGEYTSSKRFRTHCWYHIRFENHHTLTRIYGGSKFLIGPYHRHLGWHHRYGHSEGLYATHGAEIEDVGWRYATINNAVEQYFDYCTEYNILFPYYVNIWILELDGMWSGSTPLFHKRSSPLVYNWLLFPLWFFLDIPDMALFMAQGQHDVLDIYATVFHEFSHASHYEKVGNTYWENYVTHIIMNMGYGAHADGPYHGYCGIGEMWGNFAGAHFLYKYMGYNYPYVFINGDGSFKIDLYSGLSTYTRFYPYEDWYNPGILAMIHQDSQCSISNIYNALNADVYSLGALEYSLMQQGINNGIIINAYDKYHGWD